MSRIRELAMQIEHRDFDAETERLMSNWARWKTGAPIGVAVSAAYDLEARGRREEMSIPLMNGEASDVDRAVEALPPELSLVVAEYWLRSGTIRQKVGRCRCGNGTFYRRLHQAHARIRTQLQRSKTRVADVRRVLGNGGQIPLRSGNKSV